MPQENTFDDLQRLYFMLDINFNRLFAKCETDKQRDQLRAAYVNARDNFWESRKRVFQENDPIVKSLIDDLKAAQKQTERFLKNLKDIVETLKVITAAVNIGSSLITLGSSL
ncbi:MAG TPA: hypothetical protein VIK21_08545 [Desulfuromonadaceae bacterium]